MSTAAAATRALGADSHFRISVIDMSGAAIAIDGVSAFDAIRSVKERVFAANRKLPVRRQRLMYRPGPHIMEPLADDETLGGAGVARDGSAELDVLLGESTAEEARLLVSKFVEAALNGRSDDLLDLLNEGVDIESRNESGRTALISAIQNGHTHCARLLLDAGADKEAKIGRVGWTALIAAAISGHVDCARLLIEAGADKDALQDRGGYTALSWAAANGHTDCVRLLIEAGADKEVRSSDGSGALLRAAQNGHTECARLLLDAGADKNATDNVGRTGLFCAAAHGRTECVRLLIDHAAGKEAVNRNDGYTALLVAAENGHVDSVRLLINAGADVLAKSKAGKTALDLVEQTGKSGIARLLLEALPNTSSRQNLVDGQSPSAVKSEDNRSMEQPIGGPANRDLNVMAQAQKVPSSHASCLCF